MAGLGDLIGSNGVVQQLLLWQVAGQTITAMANPAFTALIQDANQAHPEMVLTPQVVAELTVRHLIKEADAKSESAKSGINSTRLNQLLALAKVRIQPADLAEAVLRSYIDLKAAEQEAAPQGIDAAQFKILRDLAGDGIGPQQAAEALRRKLMDHHGRGPDAVTYDQAIAESRLHNKWGQVLFELTRAILSPPDLAQGVVRGFINHSAAARIAEFSGVDAEQFRLMTDLAADAPSPTELAIALRRGVIPEDSGNPDTPGFVQGIRQGRLADKWIPMLRALAQEWPTPTDALEARLVGQVTTAESKALYARFGGDPAYWQLLFDTRGEAPTPLELGVLANRGAIPWQGLGPQVTSFAQGFHEGRWRNKWQDAYRHLAMFRSPESTVTLFLAHGIINDEEAADEYAKLGMDAPTAARYMQEAHLTAYSDFRGATINMALDAFYTQLITRDQALQILDGLHVTATAARLMLDFQDARRAFTAINNALSRTRTLYAARKITLATARNSLNEIGIQPTQIDGILKSWQVENSISVKVLTEAQIADAFVAQLLSEQEAFTELENIGYTPFDAWVLLSLKVKQPLPNKPLPGPAPPQDQVIPGTT
jgi:hypothetical protein